MSELTDWWVWPLAVAVATLFIWYFWHTGKIMLELFVSAVRTIQNWPQIRRAMVEQEARGGRFPWWYRAVRVVLVISLVLLAGYFIYRRLQ